MALVIQQSKDGMGPTRDPLGRAMSAPRTGRFVKLHELLESATAENIRKVLPRAWSYADHDNPLELSFVIALSLKFVQAFPGEPLPIEVE